MNMNSSFRVGDWVRVRSKEEILRTLDENGMLEQLPFMPEMLEFCGREFQVQKRAHKTCAPQIGIVARRMVNTVHLDELRCNGSAHGGCQAKCLIFWKEAWLEKVPDSSTRGATKSANSEQPDLSGPCSERDLYSSCCHKSEGESIYVCQSTQLPAASQPWRWWDPRQYVEDLQSGNICLRDLVESCVSFAYSKLVSSGIGLGSGLRWIYDAIQRIRQKTPYPWRYGKILPGSRTPRQELGLQPGELVQVRSYGEILETLTLQGHNRGMLFDPEMVPYCGKTFRVLDKVERIVDEKTGKLRDINGDCVILDKVVCNGCFAKQRKFCSRKIYPFWREIWLRRIGPVRELDEQSTRDAAARHRVSEENTMAGRLR